MAFPDSSIARSGRYSQIQLLGQGGCGHIYRAFDNDLGRMVAVKEAIRSRPGCAERFEKERRIQPQCDHRNIIQVYDLVKDDPQTHEDYLFCEYANGGALFEHLRDHGPLPEELALRIALDLCSALEALHSKRIVHRDVKPGNILLFKGDHGQITLAKLGDFGIARDLSKQPTTQLGGPQPGTLGYMPPEQADMSRPVDVRTDLYALGVCLDEMLAGRPQVSPGVAEVIQRATRDDPADRYQAPQLMAANLRDLLSGRPLAAPPTIQLPAQPTPQALQRRGRPGRMRVAGVLAACLGLVLGGYWLWPRTPTQWVYMREGESLDRSTVGTTIQRSGASGALVYGQFGSAGADPWPARPGSVTYEGITLPALDHLALQVQYSKDSPASVPILIYLDDESSPRAIFNPVDQGSWNTFVQTEPIDLGKIDPGRHSITFFTDGQRFGVADLDMFRLTAGPLSDGTTGASRPAMAVYIPRASEIAVTPDIKTPQRQQPAVYIPQTAEIPVTPIWDSTQAICTDNQSYMHGLPGTYLYRKTTENSKYTYSTEHSESSQDFSDTMKNAPPGMTSSLPHTSSTDFAGIQSKNTALGVLQVLRHETSTTYHFFNPSNHNVAEGVFKRIKWYACGYGLIYFRHSREETLNGSFSSRSESSIELLSFTPTSTNESHVRYILADMQLGEGVAIYRANITDEETAEAVRRWDAGMRVANIQELERKNISGQWLIVYAGTQSAVKGQDIITSQ